MGAFDGVEISMMSTADLPRGVWKRMFDKVKLLQHLDGCTIEVVEGVPDLWHIYMADKAVECPSCHKMVNHRVGLDVASAVCIECNGGTIHEQKQ